LFSKAADRAKMSTSTIALGLAVLLLGGALAFRFAPALLGCKIKGNISVETREHIYHVPGQKYYSQTDINVFRGERCFCSEEAAKAAGWRKSRI